MYSRKNKPPALLKNKICCNKKILQYIGDWKMSENMSEKQCKIVREIRGAQKAI